MTRAQLEDVLMDEVGPEYQSEISEAIESLHPDVEQWPDKDSLALARRMVAVAIGE